MDLRLWAGYRQYQDKSGTVHAVTDWTVAYGGVPFSALCRHYEAMKPAGELAQQNACVGCHRKIIKQHRPAAPVASGLKTNKETASVKTGDYL